jgi:methionine biosynthesis protein MetW
MRVDCRSSATGSAGARVLDLGCGDGSLLADLTQDNAGRGYGLEIDPVKISLCLERGVNVIEQDLDRGLGNSAARASTPW